MLVFLLAYLFTMVSLMGRWISLVFYSGRPEQGPEPSLLLHAYNPNTRKVVTAGFLSHFGSERHISERPPFKSPNLVPSTHIRQFTALTPVPGDLTQASATTAHPHRRIKIKTVKQTAPVEQYPRLTSGLAPMGACMHACVCVCK